MAGNRTAGVNARRVTSYDVARSAGVSQSAVSRCFRVGESVSAETRKRVLLAARTLNYTPNMIARSLITQRSRIVAVLVTEATTGSYPSLLTHLGREIQAAGHRMQVYILPGNGRADAIMPDLLGYHVDALISGVTLPGSMMQACARANVPVVVYNRTSRHRWASSVGCDDGMGMEELSQHLYDGGCRTAHFVSGPVNAPVAAARLHAAQLAGSRAGLSIKGTTHAEYSYAGGWQAAEAILAGQAPDAVMCANDAIALGVLDYCRRANGMEVPRDIAITGYDDVAEGGWASYGLTTLGQPHEALTRAAVQIAVSRAAGLSPPGERRLFPVRLLVRSSTAVVNHASTA